jgi:phage terminase large subunit
MINNLQSSTAMTPVMSLPEILTMPPKMLPMITRFNEFMIFLLEGGRGSAKSHSVGRFLLFLGEQRKLRIVCGREIQANIEESVYTLLKDLIEQYGLAYEVFKHKIVHKWSGTEFKFKGFREQGNVSVKGLEGVDILWIDEAQSISKPTLDIIMPTMRKANVKIFFTMNRYLRDDAVPDYAVGLAETLHIKINYFENQFCPLTLKNQAEIMRLKSERDYRHIWLGEPLQQADDYLFNFDKLHKAYEVQGWGDKWSNQRVLGIDFAAQGNDQCVATVLDRVTNQHWKPTERVVWDEPDTAASIGKIVHLIGKFKPQVTIIDIGGMGKVVYDRLIELGLNVIPFDGGSTDGVETTHYANWRAQGYFKLKEWFDDEFLIIDKKDAEYIKQAEKIKFKYRSNGVRIIQAKVDMKKELKYSPDDLDSLMMAVVGAVYHMGKDANTIGGNTAQQVVRRNTGTRRKG